MTTYWDQASFSIHPSWQQVSANERIQSAISTGKVDEIRTAHAILNAGNNLLSQAREQEDELQTKVSKFKKN